MDESNDMPLPRLFPGGVHIVHIVHFVHPVHEPRPIPAPFTRRSIPHNYRI